MQRLRRPRLSDIQPKSGAVAAVHIPADCTRQVLRFTPKNGRYKSPRPRNISKNQVECGVGHGCVSSFSAPTRPPRENREPPDRLASNQMAQCPQAQTATTVAFIQNTSQWRLGGTGIKRRAQRSGSVKDRLVWRHGDGLVLAGEKGQFLLGRLCQAPRWRCGAAGWSGARAKALAGYWLGNWLGVAC